MEVALTGRSFTEVAHRYAAFALYLQCVGSAGRLWQLCAERRADGLYVECSAAIVYRHLAAFAQVVAVGEALMGELLQWEAAPHEDAGFTVLAEYHVIVTQSRH